jgi:dTDP-4-dehydrorhamnose reductase
LATGGLNFVETVLKSAREKGAVKVVDDQIVSPTYALDLARKVYELIQTEHYGIFHIANRGQCSWFEFAKKIFELTNTKVKLEKTTSDEFGAKARRPAFSALDNAKLRKLGLDDLRPWPEALAAYFKETGRGEVTSCKL